MKKQLYSDEVLKVMNEWPEPFKLLSLYEDFSIDYRLNPGKNDHIWLRAHGYNTVMGGDCAYYVERLPGLNATSYGDWGTVFARSKNPKSLMIFCSMFSDGIVKLWRIRIYINHKVYDWDEGWRTYNEKLKKWVDCKNPLIKEEQGTH